MSVLTTDDRNRLAALYGSDLDDQVRESHLAAISGELAAVAPQPRPVRARRFRMAPAAAVLALFVVLPITGAIAAEQTVPGDLLYPVKLSLEPIVSVFRPDVQAEHRVEEVELLIEREASDDAVETAITRARDAVADEPIDAPLRLRLDDVVGRVQDSQPTNDLDSDEREQSNPSSDEPDPGEPGRTPTGERPPAADQPDTTPDTTTTTFTDVKPPADRPTTTTTTRQERSDDPPDDPPPADDGRGGRGG